MCTVYLVYLEKGWGHTTVVYSICNKLEFHEKNKAGEIIIHSWDSSRASFLFQRRPLSWPPTPLSLFFFGYLHAGLSEFLSFHVLQYHVNFRRMCSHQFFTSLHTYTSTDTFTQYAYTVYYAWNPARYSNWAKLQVLRLSNNNVYQRKNLKNYNRSQL